MAFEAPVADIAFWLRAVTGLDAEIAAGHFPDLSRPTSSTPCSRKPADRHREIAPLNQIGDRVGATIADGVVTMPPGWKEVFAAGRGRMDGSHGRSGAWRPGSAVMLQAAVLEMWNAASVAFSTGPMLTSGAIEAIEAHGSPEQKALYLPKLVSGRWTGTMNLTEPQAGSDLGALRARAERRATAATASSARRSSSPTASTTSPRTSSTSCWRACPTRRPARAASRSSWCRSSCPTRRQPGVRNDLKAVGLEHKLGIHASPTCVMQFGERDGAVGWLVGERTGACGHVHDDEQRPPFGRVQGVGRRAGLPARPCLCARSASGPRARLDRAGHEPDRVTIRTSSACSSPCAPHRRRPAPSALRSPRDRPVAAWTGRRARGLRRSRRTAHPDRQGFSTDVGFEVASLGVQVHGGMGFIEETGAAATCASAHPLDLRGHQRHPGDRPRHAQAAARRRRRCGGPDRGVCRPRRTRRGRSRRSPRRRTRLRAGDLGRRPLTSEGSRGRPHDRRARGRDAYLRLFAVTAGAAYHLKAVLAGADDPPPAPAGGPPFFAADTCRRARPCASPPPRAPACSTPSPPTFLTA